jgi:hypothetical protein
LADSEKQDNLIEGFASLLLGIFLIFLFFKAVVWAWNIHPVFGVLLFLFLVG